MTERNRTGRHPDLTPLFDEFGSPLASEARDALLAHVLDCPRCARALADHEPSALFGVLARDAVPEEILDRFDRGLAARLDGPRSAPSRRRLTAWAGVAASFVLAALLGTYVVTRGPATVADARSTQRDPAPMAVFEGPEPIVISSPGVARVLDLTVGEVELVMIFDEALHL